VTGLVSYYVLLALSVGGTVVLRRRRIPSFPLWAIGLQVVCSVALTFGQTRYRTTFEVSLVLLAAVQIEWFWSRLRGGTGSEAQTAQGPDPELRSPESATEPPVGTVPTDRADEEPGVAASTT
jgi:hypothetical protein